MASKPATVPTWATTATGIARTTDPGGTVRGDGWDVSDRPPSGWWNWMWNTIGAWLAFLNDPDVLTAGDVTITSDFTSTGGGVTVTGDIVSSAGALNVSGNITATAAGSSLITGTTGHVTVGTGGVLSSGDLETTGGANVVSSGYVETAEEDVRHATRTLVIGAAAAHLITGFDTFVTPGSYHRCPASTAGALHFTIPLAIGDRLREVRVIAETNGSAASDISAILYSTDMQVGGDSTDASTTLVGSTNLPAAVTTTQAITLDPADNTLAAGTSFEVLVSVDSSTGTKIVFRIEVDFDRVA